MKEFSDTELRKLDAFILTNVMRVKTVGDLAKLQGGLVEHAWSPTTDPAAAMQVLEKCISKIKDTRGALELMQWDDGKFSVYAGDSLQAMNLSLPLAICHFAKQLFTK